MSPGQITDPGDLVVSENMLCPCVVLGKQPEGDVVMDETGSTDRETLSLSTTRQVDAVCDRFEAALRAGEELRIEAYLDEVRAPRGRHCGTNCSSWSGSCETASAIGEREQPVRTQPATRSSVSWAGAAWGWFTRHGSGR